MINSTPQFVYLLPDDPPPNTLHAPGEFSIPLASSDKYPGGGLSLEKYIIPVTEKVVLTR